MSDIFSGGLSAEEIRKRAKQIRLIALDMDGTSMDSNSQITPRTRAAIQALVDKGYLVVPATGRGFYDLREKIIGVAGIRYVISANGAVVTDGLDGSRLYENLIPCREAAKLAEELLDHNCCVYIHRNDGKSTHVMSCKSREIYERFFYDPKMPKPRDVMTEDLRAFILEDNRDVIKIGMFFRAPETFSGFARMVADHYPEISCFQVSDQGMEFVHQGADKAEALAVLCEKLQIPLSRVCAFGDNGNDVEMIRRAGLGVAVENAIPEARMAADHVAGSNDGEGVAEFIETYLL